MIDFSSLPSTEAELLNEINASTKGVRFTFTESVDERNLYNDLNKRLNILETSLEIDKKELNTIQQENDRFKVSMEEKEEVLLRIDWLKRLDDVKEAIQSVKTKEAVEQLRRKIASVQTCPMKNELISKLDSLAQSMPSKQTKQQQLSPEQVLMGKAIEEAGDAFINLGKAGREDIITDVLKKYGEQATVKDVQERTAILEQQVARLAELMEPKQLISKLEDLPLPSFTSLPSERKDKVARRLLELNKWSGIASLERMIVHMNKAITNEERQQAESKNTMHTSDGKAALTLDINNLDNDRIQLSVQ